MIEVNPYKLKLQPNWLLLSFDLQEFVSQTAELQNGLRVDKRFEKYEYAVVTGQVVGICDTLFYLPSKGDWHEAPLEYDAQIEVEVGDTVFFNYLSAEKAVAQGRMIEWEGKYFGFMRYDRLYATIRRGEWYGVNGWKIIQPRASMEVKTGFTVSRPNKKGVVVGNGKPVEDYWDKHYPETGWIKWGDEVEYITAIPLENKYFSKHGEFYRVREKDVLYSDRQMNPTVIEVTKVRNRMVGSFDITNTTLERGISSGEEVIYHREYEYINPEGRVFVRRIDKSVEFLGEKLLMPI